MKNNLKMAMVTAAVMMATGGMDSGYQPTRRTKPKKRPRNSHQDAININRAKDRRSKRRAKRLTHGENNF